MIGLRTSWIGVGRIRATIAVLGLTLALAGPAWAESTCEGLTATKLDNASVTSAKSVPAGTFTPPPGPIASKPMALAAYCRIEGVARPTKDSEIKFELWLPDAKSWNGNFEQIGNGGYAGSISAAALAGGVSRGFATAATDDGHTGMNAKFAPGHPEKVIDFGHRAVHLTAVHSKALVQAYYGKAPKRSYFLGCSDGGREALMEAQRYPDDFIGIVAGAPANYWTRLLTSAIWNWSALNATPASLIPPTKLAAIQKAAVAACDQVDGVKDGLIDDPRRCQFKPSSIGCKGADGPDCLTAPQVTALEKIYQGWKSPKNGQLMFPPMVMGTEAVPGNWIPWLIPAGSGQLPFQAWFGTTFYQDMVFENAKWDFKTMDFDRDFTVAMGKVAGVLDASDHNLAPFKKRGGKLIQYHGWGDAAIPAGSSIEYYEKVAAAVPGTPDFYRLFLVAGMGHCGEGMGPNDFGNLGLAGPSRTDPETDISAALDRWVEKGIAPDKLVATGIRPGEPPNDPSKGIKLTRPLCPYPQVATYRGTGSTDDAANFACSAPKAGGR